MVSQVCGFLYPRFLYILLCSYFYCIASFTMTQFTYFTWAWMNDVKSPNHMFAPHETLESQLVKLKENIIRDIDFVILCSHTSQHLEVHCVNQVTTILFLSLCSLLRTLKYHCPSFGKKSIVLSPHILLENISMSSIGHIWFLNTRI